MVRMTLKNQIGTAFVWNHAARITGYALDLLLSIILARGLGAHDYGVWSELYTLIFLFSMLCSFGLDTSANVFVPKLSRQKLSAYLRFSLFIFIALSLLSLFLMNALSTQWNLWFDSPLSTYIGIASLYMVFFAFSIWMNALLISFYDLKFSFIINVGFKTIVSAGAWLLLYSGYGIRELLYLMTATLAAVVCFFSIRHGSLLFAKSTAIDRMRIWRFNVVAWLTKFLNYLLGRYSDIFILGLFQVVNEEIAYFNLSFSLTMALFYLFTAGFGGVSLTLFSKAVHEGKLERVQRGWTMILKVIILFCLPVFCFFILHADMIMVLLYSDDFIPAASLFRVFALFYLISILTGAGVNSAVLYAFERQSTVFRLRAIFGTLNILLDLLLIRYWGVMGAIVATGISTVAIIAFELIAVRQSLSIRYPFIFLLKIVLAVGIGLLLISLLISVPTPLLLIIKAFAYFGVVLAGLAMFKPFDRQDFDFIEKELQSIAFMVRPFVKFQA
ncbi:oligosaccharide flippase family protein [candidate division KSB1 bacterium]|nr:oligosaccharide flippase family protein [candidate division KSB1 bacterium]